MGDQLSKFNGEQGTRNASGPESCLGAGHGLLHLGVCGLGHLGDQLGGGGVADLQPGVRAALHAPPADDVLGARRHAPPGVAQPARAHQRHGLQPAHRGGRGGGAVEKRRHSEGVGATESTQYRSVVNIHFSDMRYVCNMASRLDSRVC